MVAVKVDDWDFLTTVFCYRLFVRGGRNRPEFSNALLNARPSVERAGRAPAPATYFSRLNMAVTFGHGLGEDFEMRYQWHSWILATGFFSALSLACHRFDLSLTLL